MIVFPTRLCVAYRQTIGPLSCGLWIKLLHSLLNMLSVKDMYSILLPDIWNNFAPEFFAVPCRRALQDDVRTFFVVPVSAKNIVAHFHPLSSLFSVDRELRAANSVARKNSELVEACYSPRMIFKIPQGHQKAMPPTSLSSFCSEYPRSYDCLADYQLIRGNAEIIWPRKYSLHHLSGQNVPDAAGSD